MALDYQLVGPAVGMAWVVREFIGYLKFRAKNDREDDDKECSDHCKNYRPDEQWKNYCIQRFDKIDEHQKDIREDLGKMYMAQEIMKTQVLRLEAASLYP